jgi:hypothetical protein
MTDLPIRLLAELLDEAYRPTPIRQLATGKRKAYHARAVGKTRAKVEAALASGVVPVNRQHIRDTLTDAALHILVTNGPGADVIRDIFGSVFGDDDDVAMARIEQGKITPRFFQSS